MSAPPDRRGALGALLAVAAAAVVALLWWSPDPFAADRTVLVRVPDAGALAGRSSEVRVAGTPVGEVVGRRAVPGGAELELRVRADAPRVHRDATVVVRPRLLFEGTGFVDLDPGSPAAPVLGTDEPLSLARGKAAVSLADALEVLGPGRARDLRTVVRESALTARPRTSAAVGAVLDRAPALVARGARVATAARGGRRAALRGAIAGLHRTAAALGSRSRDLTAITTRIPAVADAARAGREGDDAGALDAALARMPAATRRLRRGADALDATVRAIRPTAVALRPAARQLAPTIADLRPVLRAAAPAATRATPLLRDAREVLARASAAAPSAQRVLRRTEPSLRTLQDSTLGGLEAKTRLGTPAYLAFLGLFAGGGGASRPFLADEGHFMRFGLRFLTGAGAPLPPCTLLERVQPQLASALAEHGGCTP